MCPVCQFILLNYAAGIPIRRICQTILVGFTVDNNLGPVGYMQVSSWLTMSKYAEEYKEFRKEFITIQKNRLPLQMDELLEDAQELKCTPGYRKNGDQIIEPSHWDTFRARFACLKFLYAYHHTRPRHSRIYKKPLTPTVKNVNATESDIPLSPSSQLSFANLKSEIGNLKPLGLGLNIPNLTHAQAEEILESPIPPYSEDDFEYPSSDDIEHPTSACLQSFACPQSLGRGRSTENPTSEIVNLKSEIVPPLPYIVDDQMDPDYFHKATAGKILRDITIGEDIPEPNLNFEDLYPSAPGSNPNSS